MKKHKKKKCDLSQLRLFSLLLGFIILFISGGLLFFLKNQVICANSISCIKDLSGVYKASEKEGIFLGKKINVPTSLASDETLKKVLGQSNASNKHIYIDLSNQKIYAYEGKNLIYSFLISSGKWGKTPTGDFNIWIKLRYTRMEGGNSSIGTYYNLPNVPYTMYFYNNEAPKSRGFGIHGTYWHNNFGHPMSHGCVNMKTEEVEKLYYWTDPQIQGNVTYATGDNPGTPITIYGAAPNE